MAKKKKAKSIRAIEAETKKYLLEKELLDITVSELERKLVDEKIASLKERRLHNGTKIELLNALVKISVEDEKELNRKYMKLLDSYKLITEAIQKRLGLKKGFGYDPKTLEAVDR